MKLIHLIIISILTLFLGLNLKSQVDSDIIGKYKRTGSLGFKASIELMSDSTFVYKWYIGMMGGISTGKWKMKGRKVILNSNRQPNENKSDFTYTASIDSLTNKTTIKVQTDKGINIPTANCIVFSNGNKFVKSTDSLGIAIFNIHPVERIKILFVGFKPVDFENNNPKRNNFTFFTQVIDDPYHYFTNEKWIYKNGKLFDRKIKSDRWTKKYYEKIE